MKNIKISILLLLLSVLTTSSIHAEKYKYESDNNSNLKSTKALTAGCVPATTSTELELNNVRALIHTGGDMWWDLQDNPRYEIPKGSEKTALFAGSIWIGGTDLNGQLKLAALRFRSNGVDYWPGPLVTSGPDRGTVTSDVCLEYDRHFTITRNEVSEFVSWYNADAETRAEEYSSYSIPNIILEWPAHGDVASGYDYYLAPFQDVDGDGFYDPYSGDYPFYDLEGELPCGTSRDERVPRLYGDQTLWWVYNDRGNLHTESEGDPIGMEIRAQAFAFSTNDELNDMTFYNYALINRSTYTLTETYFGVWTDADMGYPQDDYVGCDVNRGLGYLYNGEDVDGSGQYNAYGGPTPPPPAIGVDFFEGPYQDADFIDNPSSWDPVTGELICDGNIMNGNINGLNFGDGIVDNERWGMRRFIYFENDPNLAIGDPSTAPEYYYLLRGYWKNGTRMVYGENGYPSSSMGELVETDFMFPNDTDPCGWGQAGQVMPTWNEVSVSNNPGDRRFVHSAGPFTLEPGAVNDITTGIVWARATGGDPYQSVEEVKVADDKAQLLFDNCFKVVNGPDAPELDVIELDQQVVFHIYNTPASNNYLEQYTEVDFSIINIDIDADDVVDVVDKEYHFEGYQVFQLKNSSVSIGDITNVNLAREVYQCDLKNDVDDLVNFTWDKEMEANVPEMMVEGANEGIEHSFVITTDAFAQGDDALVNHKKYYFAIIAYGYNNFMEYDQNSPNGYKGQKEPYKAGRKGATGAIQIYEVIPHIPDPSNGGTVVNAEYGEGLSVTQLEGFGSGPNFINLSEETIDEIMSGEPWKVDKRKYEAGAGPIQVKVVDPLNIPEGEFAVAFDPDSTFYNPPSVDLWDWMVYDTKWKVYQTAGDKVIDTIYSTEGITVRNEQIISELGVSIIVEFQEYIDLSTKTTDDLDIVGSYSSTYSFDPVSENWLSFLPDGDDFNSLNWIRAGTQEDVNNVEYNDYSINSVAYDKEEGYEKILNGTWAPFEFTSNIEHGPGWEYGQANIRFSKWRLPSVEFVITDDKSKWTRACVIETSEDDTSDTGADIKPIFGQGDAWKFELRDTFSIDKNGNFATVEEGSESESDANYVSGRGMGWFPGYAIDTETGSRLNIVYGEASEYPGENGRDMRWNPTSSYYTSFGEELFGGKHYIYLVGDNFFLKSNHTDTDVYMPAYDGGKRLYELLSGTKTQRRKAFRNFIWTSIPILSPGYANKDFYNEVLPSAEYRMKIRSYNPHRIGHYMWAPQDSLNDGFPLYTFDTYGIATTKNDTETAKDALDKINIVPNPYYGYSEYELTQIDNLVKLTNLPEKCTISIYNVGGTLIRRFKKDSKLSYQDWDLKNQYGITIASGVYIIHVDGNELGEKILKWFGALRPIDLNAF